MFNVRGEQQHKPRHLGWETTERTPTDEPPQTIRERTSMTEAEETELAMWDARCNDLQNSLERVREERDDLKELIEQLTKQLNVATETGIELHKELSLYKQMVERMRIAMSQGLEL